MHGFLLTCIVSFKTLLAMLADRQPHQQQWMFSFSAQQQHTQQEGPDISRLDLALQRQWDHVANAHLGSTVIAPMSHKKVWWICDQCPDGHLHSWSAAVRHRSNGTECPQCSGHKVCQHNTLATKTPGVAAQWDHEENSTTPDTITAQSVQVVAWHCDACGHKWRVSPHARISHSSGCPHCAKFARAKLTRHPTFAECQDPGVRALLVQWDFEGNGASNNHPDNTRLQSSKQIWWLCTKCPAGQKHRWSARPDSRTCSRTAGCPVCAGRVACRCNSLQALHPDIAAEWDHSKNEDQPSDYIANSNHLAWWSSPQLAADHKITNKHSPAENCKAATYQTKADFVKLKFSSRACLCSACPGDAPLAYHCIQCAS